MITLSGSVEEVMKLLEENKGKQVHAVLGFYEDIESQSKSPELPAASGDGGRRPFFLNIDEVAEMLGLSDRKSPRDAVKYLHRTRQLSGTLVQGRLRWRPEDIEEYARKAGASSASV